ncbi:MAG TPA: glycosyltransferase [Solirubrobacteraceae bacterium]
MIDGLPIRGRNSLAMVVENLLDGWTRLGTGDELHLALGRGAEVAIPEGVAVHEVDLGARHYINRLRAQNTLVPRLCREVAADVMLGVLPTTTIGRLPCPRALIAWDLRFELRPEQFSRQTRLQRALFWGIGFRQADAIVTISERTRDDLLRSRPWLRERVVRAAPLGGDHVTRWPARRTDAEPYAITFGQWSNKNVGLVVDAWAMLGNDAPALRVVGLGQDARAQLEAKIAALGLGGRVQALPWLSDEEFQAQFASAAMVVFPSDFEGFGLPAVEALQLGIPLVITPEPALLEVTAGKAAVMDGWDADALVAAVRAARELSPQQLEAAREHGLTFTWSRTAELTREALAQAIGRVAAAG